MDLRRTLTAALLLSTTPAVADVDLRDVDLQTFETCDDLVRGHSEAPGAYSCFHLVGERLKRWDEAASRLEKLIQLRPDAHYASLSLGRVYNAMRRPGEAEKVLQQAIDGFSNSSDTRGEVLARGDLAYILRGLKRGKEARDHVARSIETAQASGTESILASAMIDRAWQERFDEEHRAAWKDLKEAEAVLLPDGDWLDQERLFDAIGAVAFDLRRWSDAWSAYKKQRELWRGISPVKEATILKNMGLVAGHLGGEGQLSVEEVITLRREALASAVRAGDRRAEVGARLQLVSALRRPDSIAEASRAVALAREIDSPDLEWALWVLGEQTQQMGPERREEARRYFDEAIASARAKGDRRKIAQGLVVRAAATMMAGERERAIAESLEALDAVEKRRDLQIDREVRSRLFATHTTAYRRFAAWLMGAGSFTPSREDLALSVSVIERLHARELLDSLDAGRGSGDHGSRGPSAEARAGVLEEIARLQQNLVKPGLSARERQSLLQELDRLEVREAELRERIAREDPRFAALRRPDFASIDRVQEALAPHQAVVLFLDGLIGGRDAQMRYQKARAISITTNDVATTELLDRWTIIDEVENFVGLIERRDSSENDGAARLHDELMRGITARMPREITELIIAPDGVLHRVPFAALIDRETGEPLAARYEITTIPSATAWLRWTREAKQAPARSLLALADPALPAEGSAAESRGTSLFAEALRLGRLPHARREAAAMVRWIGGEGQVLTGTEATEAAFKSSDLRGYRIIHLATHALLDDESPERSAVILAREAAGQEDGLLQFREILDLDLEGQIILLTACRSASGRIIGGEGPVGLASAFLQAGAQTVLASVSPLGDEESAWLVEELARSLGRGADLGRALSEARRALIHRGAPTAAWSGLVLLGNPDLVPFPEGSGGRSRLLWVSLPIGLALAITLGWLVRRRTRTHAATASA